MIFTTFKKFFCKCKSTIPNTVSLDGTVWSAVIDGPYFYCTGLSFGEWYRFWIDQLIERALAVLENERLVKQIEVGMTKAQVIAICGETWKKSNFGSESGYLKFDNLATEFEMNQDDVVTRIIDHAVYLRKY